LRKHTGKIEKENEGFGFWRLAEFEILETARPLRAVGGNGPYRLPASVP
jgi:hypothetical protein